MIQVYSFEEWDPLQPQENIIEWGHMKGVKSAEAGWNSSPYKDAPLEIRQMFYTEYVMRLTNPK